MPSSNKGSRIAASQARAKVAAKKKARSGGPDLSGLTVRPESADASDADENVELEEGAVSVAEVSDDGVEVAEAAPAPAAAAPLVRRSRGASRRERQAMTVVAAGSLKWELSLIGSATVAMAVALVVLKLVTDIGR